MRRSVAWGIGHQYQELYHYIQNRPCNQEIGQYMKHLWFYSSSQYILRNRYLNQLLNQGGTRVNSEPLPQRDDEGCTAVN